MLWLISVIVSGRHLSIQSHWISLYDFYLHLTTWKTGMVYSYIWIFNLSPGIFCVTWNSIPPLLISAKVLMNRMKAEITLFSRNPYECVSKWKCFHDNYKKLPVREMQFLERKWNPANKLQSRSLYHLSLVFPFLKGLVLSEAISQALWQELW